MFMSRNIYDTFRSVQEKRKNCYDERSAAFIVEGQMAQSIYHKRKNLNIQAALVFEHKEGPDDIIVYTLLDDDLLKSDYFVWKSTNFLVYEENRITDKDVIYRKQKALECNVTFKVGEKTFLGYFLSSMRKAEDPTLLGKQFLSPDETPILILPTNTDIGIKTEFVIEGKPFVVVEYDHITNKGITYYYLERGTIKNIEEGDTTIIKIPEIVENIGTIEQEDTEEELTLKAMLEYTFATEGAMFSSTPAVEVLSRGLGQVKFRIPFGIEAVTIMVRINGINIEKMYKVVL